MQKTMRLCGEHKRRRFEDRTSHYCAANTSVQPELVKVLLLISRLSSGIRLTS